MLNYHRWLDRLQAIERKKRTSGSYLIALILTAFVIGVLSHQIWLSFAPEVIQHSSSGKRKLLDELEQQAKVLASRNLALTIEQEANKNLQQMFSEQLVRQKELEKELRFYRSLMVPETEVDGVMIHGVELLPGMVTNQQQLRVILTQQQKRKANVQVSVDADFIGVQADNVSEYRLSKLNDKTYQFGFKYFYVMDTDFSLPADFVLQRINIKVTVQAARGVKGGSIEQVFDLADINTINSEITNSEKEPRVILEQNSQVSDNSPQ
ncbi:DUF6776 family protein [Shewanella aestuarii]|uniref:Uncharacterized protein n=1 Tax=Shewanella aestuarii TaxID=1028752 RepID=A0A6G9QL20_9GAMM|nr:DUF6776 family protein [Shewanella aestuarii]QIR15270.1 hypothetical protein HBH39_12880 [Shewanella aestuarii]